ncbi:transcription factor TFIIH complex subunit Pmh1 [Schizosaccharomyces japonicus yFS275]|uniref:RNA polymerase II transcription factor B subunit 3 n=1 Tax=Schizosaccharomyces japonicus (strain yFS275 / FY16936) TaxID=402676 RepID=B6K4Q6_SCHJY|nr:transcription factor TFIIH complex subunit Pmh1 [Schizosaccharomyces japonicus yFS275]EEB08463.2 transcription factor TFIIH complex subunit Pmh1 [Schizosaccharomyces japonicus yFS275]
MEIEAPRKPDEKCPLCQADRYLNPNMKLLINPECYHKMCESCVDRIFTTGPAPCPTPGCGRILRKAKFREQTFEDAQIEREIDIRRRMAKIFNKTQQDFASLQAYNDYLEQVENLTFNLIYDIDVEQTEAQVQAYEKQNQESIATNSARALAEARALAHNEMMAKKQKQQAREAILQEEELERKHKAEVEQQIIHDLATSGKDPNKIVELSSTLKRQRNELHPAMKTFSTTGFSNALFGNAPVIPNVPAFDPLEGTHAPSKYFDERDLVFDDPYLEKLEQNVPQLAGFRSSYVHQRALYDAFCGLDFDLNLLETSA